MLRRGRFHCLFHFRSRGISRIARSLTDIANYVPGAMADLSGNISSPVSYSRGHVTRRVTDGSTDFFQWGASR